MIDIIGLALVGIGSVLLGFLVYGMGYKSGKVDGRFEVMMENLEEYGRKIGGSK